MGNGVEKLVTCAVALFDGRGRLLIAHPTGAPAESSWSLPKGLPDDGEGRADAAIRELKEECGIGFPKAELKWVGERAYLKNKRLDLFAGELAGDGRLLELSCESMFEDSSGVLKPEVDEYEWASPKKAKRLLNPKQWKILENDFPEWSNGGPKPRLAASGAEPPKSRI